MVKPPICLLNFDSLQFLSNFTKKLPKFNYPLHILYKNLSQVFTKPQAVEHIRPFFEVNNKDLQINPQQIFFPSDYLHNLIDSYMKNLDNNLILLCGEEENINKFASNMNYTNYLTMSEYCKLFPILVPISKRTRQEIEPTKVKIIRRMPFLGRKSFNYPFQIKAVFFLGDVIDWEEYGQVIIDLMSTKDGNIAKKLPEKAVEPHIPIYFTSNEIFSYDEKGNKIMGLGALKETLNTCYKLIYKKELVFNENEKASPEEEILTFIGNFLSNKGFF